MLTKKDIQIINNIFDQKFDEKFEPVYTQIRSDIVQFKDDILTELRAMREELIVLNGRTAETRDTAEDHEKRIVRLENHPALAKCSVH